MPELPVWLQGIRDRADKATPGPWYRNGSYIPGRKSMVVRSPWTDKQRGDLHVAQCAEAKLSKGLIAKTSFGSVDRGRDPEWDNRDADAEFIAHARTDVPRLLELVGEMGEALRLAGGALDEACDVMHGGHHPGQLLDKAFYASVAVDSALAKYHGEAEPTTPNESYWWCPSCGCEVDGTRVTYEELHDVCGHSVEWREEVKSDD